MKLSIIIPCYNVDGTLIRALDSILMQEVNFPFEVIIVDDASTDETVAVAKRYQSIHKNDLHIKILCNKANKGNAFTFYTGLCESQGDYFCVLDGDDYYTITDKLQRQVDFLDSDINREYVAVATQFIIDLGEGKISIPNRSTYQEFTYVDFLTQHSGYYHTATYMYRNIFRGNVPPFFSEKLYRGDTPRTTFHLMYSGKKIKVLDFVGSAYTFEFTGIWSSLSQKEQFNYQIHYQSEHKKRLTTEFEQKAADRLIKFNSEKLESAKDEFRKYPLISIEEAVKYIGKYVNRFAFADLNFMLKHVYNSLYIDTLSASIGYINRIHNANLIQEMAFENRIAIVIGVLNPHGGGIFAEIEELIDIYKNKRVYLIVTNMNEVPSEIKDALMQKHPNLTVVAPVKGEHQRVAWLMERMKIISPCRCYYYCSHNDPYASVLMQKGPCENLCLFSFDHGFLCGITNPNLDVIIAKRPVDYVLLRKVLKDKVIFIPTWNESAKGIQEYCYEPFKNHTHLITASGAARYYKIDGASPKKYIDMIIELLSRTQGKHFHFGPIPDEELEKLHQKMREHGVDFANFIHIPWSENIPLDLLKNNVDIFVEPFPVVSYKLTLEVLSAGVPIIANNGLMRMHIMDFAPPNTLRWSYPEEFYEKLCALDADFLRKASGEAISYFKTYHDKEYISGLLYENKGVAVENSLDYTDDTLVDISGSLRLFGDNFKFSIQDGTLTPSEETLARRRQQEEKKKRELEEKKKREQEEKRRRELEEKKKREQEEKRRRELEEKKKREQEEKKREQEEKRRRELEKIIEIRKSKSFRLGYLVTFPFRLIKHTCFYTLQYGLNEGMLQMEKEGVLSLRKANPQEELDALKHSTAYKIGNAIAKPYRFLKGK